VITADDVAVIASDGGRSSDWLKGNVKRAEDVRESS